MKRIGLFATLPILLFCASCVSAIDLNGGSPKITVYQPSESSVVVYDARPELGIVMGDMTGQALNMVKDLGIRLVRHTLYWNQMETTDKPGLYESVYLAEWDKLVEKCRKESVCLEVVVQGDPLGVSFKDRKAGFERLARFVGDMAARYPSVAFWELFDEPDSESTGLFGARDSAPMRDRGKFYAEMLRVVTPAIRAANPSAWVVCGGMRDTGEFPRGLYEGGGRNYFDIMSIHTFGAPVVKAFVDRGREIRQVMTESGDATKPLWNTAFGLDAESAVSAWGYPHSWSPAQDDAKSFDAKQLDDIQNCFQMNNQLHLYSKLLIYEFQGGGAQNPKSEAKLPQGLTIDDFGFGIVRKDLSPRPAYKWLSENLVNAAVVAKPETTRSVFVPTKTPMVALGYDFRVVDGGIEIQRVAVDELIPTRLSLSFAGEPEPAKHGTNPARQPGKNPARPIPNPYDI